MADWNRLCGLAVTITGSQDGFRREARILQRLVRKFGPEETETMLQGAKLLGWRTLVSLGSREGLGRRWAQEAYWRSENARQRVRFPAPLRAIFKNLGDQ